MDRGAFHTCERCDAHQARIAELEELVAWQRSELGESSDANLLTRLRELYGLTRSEGRLLEALYGAKGRVVPYRRLFEMIGPGERDGDTLKLMQVYAHHIRKKVGVDAVFTSWGIGLAVGPSGIEAYDAAKAQAAA